MKREGWLMDPRTRNTKYFHRDITSWQQYPYIFIDTGKPMIAGPALLKRREHLHVKDATIEWKRLRSEGWHPVEPQWGPQADGFA